MDLRNLFIRSAPWLFKPVDVLRANLPLLERNNPAIRRSVFKGGVEVIGAQIHLLIDVKREDMAQPGQRQISFDNTIASVSRLYEKVAREVSVYDIEVRKGWLRRKARPALDC